MYAQCDQVFGTGHQSRSVPVLPPNPTNNYESIQTRLAKEELPNGKRTVALSISQLAFTSTALNAINIYR